MADLLAGYPHWAIPTAIIKALNVLPFFLIKLLMTDRKKLEKIIHLQNLTLVTLGGYFVANALMYDAGAAIAELLPNLIQALASGVLFVAVGLGLDAVRFNSKVLRQ